MILIIAITVIMIYLLKNIYLVYLSFVFEVVCVIGMILVVCCRLALDRSSPEFVSNIAVFVVATFRIMPSLGRITNTANIIVNYASHISKKSRDYR